MHIIDMARNIGASPESAFRVRLTEDIGDPEDPNGYIPTGTEGTVLAVNVTTCTLHVAFDNAMTAYIPKGTGLEHA